MYGFCEARVANEWKVCVCVGIEQLCKQCGLTCVVTGDVPAVRDVIGTNFGICIFNIDGY